MSKILTLIAILCFTATVYFGVEYSGVFTTDARVEQDKTQKKWSGHASPNISFKGLKEGEVVKLANFKGNVILVNFWASWCEPCSEEFPAMLRLLDHFKGQLHMVAVSNDSEKKLIYEFLKKFKKQYASELKNSSLHIAWDPTLEITQEHFNVLRLPETFILNRQHKIVRKIIGVTDWDGTEMKSYIAKLLVD